MKFKRSLLMTFSIASVVALVFLGAQLQLPTAFALPRVHGPRVFAVPGLTSSHTWTLGTNACAGSGCHTSTGSPGTATVTGFPASMTYTPGTPIPLTVSITDAGQSFYGFELTSRLATNTATQAGSFTAGTGTNTATDVVPVIQGGPSSTSTFSFTWTPPATASGSVNLYLSALAGSFPNADTYSPMYVLTPAAATTPDFSLAGTATSLTATQGGTSGADTITVTPLNGFTGNVTLSTSTLPSGVSATFGTNPTAGSSSLKFTASSTAATGTSTVTITGVSGSLSHTTTVSFTVNAPALVPNFSLAGSATSLTATQGGTSGADTITVNPLNGFTGNVTLSTSTLPSGVSATFGTNPTAGSSSLKFTASSTAATGTSTVTITGVSGSLSHTTTVSLTVNATTTTSALSVSPLTMTFNYQQGSPTPASQPIMVTGTPTGLAFTAVASGASWLSVSPSSGTLPGTTNTSVTPGTLPPGTYTGGKVTITATGATGSPQIVNVTLVITSVTTTSELTVTPNSLNFTSQQGGSTPSPQSLNVRDSANKHDSFTASYSGGSWVRLNPTSGSTPGNISVSVVPGGMPAGTYNGDIQISSPGKSSVSVPITFTITSATEGTSGAMYAQPYVYDPTSSRALAAMWVNGLGVGIGTQSHNRAMVLVKNASAPAGSWAGVNILNVSGVSLTELGFDYRDGSQCTATSPRFIVITTDSVTHVLGGCSTGTIQTNVPYMGWRRVRFDQTHIDAATPPITPGMQVQSITLVMDQGPDSVTGASGGFAVIDNIDVNGTLITGPKFIDD
ncbi:MAG TPA: hypothetical protein VK709_06470 [Candidatus Saccharimonadales bacterium]|nr:hypothetical protein [Candidatus Saccharimonadales bacterium]